MARAVLNPAVAKVVQAPPCEGMEADCRGVSAIVATYIYEDYDRAVPDYVRLTGAYCLPCSKGMENTPPGQKYIMTTVWVSFE